MGELHGAIFGVLGALFGALVSVITIVVYTSKAQSALFEKMGKMMDGKIATHTKDSEAHEDIRTKISEYQEVNDQRWENHKTEVAEAKSAIIAASGQQMKDLMQAFTKEVVTAIRENNKR